MDNTEFNRELRNFAGALFFMFCIGLAIGLCIDIEHLF